MSGDRVREIGVVDMQVGRGEGRKRIIDMFQSKYAVVRVDPSTHDQAGKGAAANDIHRGGAFKVVRQVIIAFY